jgi:predicted ribosome quality control (RQC) complex YloA/Tae2 family protein
VHNNFYFLRQLSASLETLLTGSVISECFSQSRNELIIRFEIQAEPYFIKASLDPSFSCLSFPKTFHRARKNSVDLFPSVIGTRVEGIRQFENERSFAILLSDNLALMFKMHGNRSNLVLLENGLAIDLFQKNIPGDSALELSRMDRSIDWSKENFLKHLSGWSSLYFTFGKVVWQYLDQQAFQSKTPEDQWLAIQELLTSLNQPKYYIIDINGQLHLSLLAFGKIVNEFANPVEAITEFFYTYTHQSVYQREKQKAISTLHGTLHGAELFCKKIRSKLDEAENDHHFKTWADLLMANLHAVAPGSDKITLPDFTNPIQHTIKLKSELSPQKNAEIYYRKAKNHHIEIDRLKASLAAKELDIRSLNANLHALESAIDLVDLRKKIKDAGLGAPEKKQAAAPLPYHEFLHKGYKIWVGKNAQANDELTFKYGYKEDLWLHAKDVAGSHVLIKHQAGKNFPRDVVERAASLAAYNSKRKTDTLAPVTFTPRKFVRKRKGDPAGMVVVEREEVILVEPTLE